MYQRHECAQVTNKLVALNTPIVDGILKATPSIHLTKSANFRYESLPFRQLEMQAKSKVKPDLWKVVSSVSQVFQATFYAYRWEALQEPCMAPDQMV